VKEEEQDYKDVEARAAIARAQKQKNIKNREFLLCTY